MVVQFETRVHSFDAHELFITCRGARPVGSKRRHVRPRPLRRRGTRRAWPAHAHRWAARDGRARITRAQRAHSHVNGSRARRAPVATPSYGVTRSRGAHGLRLQQRCYLNLWPRMILFFE